MLFYVHPGVLVLHFDLFKGMFALDSVTAKTTPISGKELLIIANNKLGLQGEGDEDTTPLDLKGLETADKFDAILYMVYRYR